jgi:hypothetical protein
MPCVALSVDRNGVLNAAFLDGSSAGWQGPATFGNACLVPGSPVTVFQQSSSIYMALAVDREGTLNVFSLDVSAGAGWQGPDSVGNTSLVPGSPVTVFQQSGSTFTALMVDRNGVLNEAWLNVGDGWQGPDTIGSACLTPGSKVTVVAQSASVFAALMVDRNGVLNIATLDTVSGEGWQGPDTFGNATLVPGSSVYG